MFAPMHQPTSARDRLEQCLARIADPTRRGGARLSHRLCRRGPRRRRRGRCARPDRQARSDRSTVSWSASRICSTWPARSPGPARKCWPRRRSPAAADAPVVARLRAAGAVIVAKTNMTEFAFSGVGANPHYGTPGNPADRTRIPGGSTSGGAVAVADRMCEIAIGTDTGGSTRIPAALCGIVGFKPSKSRVPTDGAFPLSYTLDSVGPMARSVADCAAADAVMAGKDAAPLEPAPIAGLKIGIAQGLPLEALDENVEKCFAQALAATGQGRRDACASKSFALLDDMVRRERQRRLRRRRGFFHSPRAAAAARRRRRPECPLSHRARRQDVGGRLHRHESGARPAWCAPWMRTSPPSTSWSCRRPRSSRRRSPRWQTVNGFAARNAALLRNTAIVNIFDLCAISLPLPGRLPVGLMLVARNRHDRRLFQIAAGLERLFAA